MRLTECEGGCRGHNGVRALLKCDCWMFNTVSKQGASLPCSHSSLLAHVLCRLVAVQLVVDKKGHQPGSVWVLSPGLAHKQNGWDDCMRAFGLCLGL